MRRGFRWEGRRLGEANGEVREEEPGRCRAAAGCDGSVHSAGRFGLIDWVMGACRRRQTSWLGEVGRLAGWAVGGTGYNMSRTYLASYAWSIKFK